MSIRLLLRSFLVVASFISAHAATFIENDNWRNSFNGMGAGPVYDCLTTGENVFVAGPSNAGGFVAPGVARWNGSQWKIDPVIGASGFANIVAASSEGVLAAGNFKVNQSESAVMRW